MERTKKDQGVESFGRCGQIREAVDTQRNQVWLACEILAVTDGVTFFFLLCQATALRRAAYTQNQASDAYFFTYILDMDVTCHARRLLCAKNRPKARPMKPDWQIVGLASVQQRTYQPHLGGGMCGGAPHFHFFFSLSRLLRSVQRLGAVGNA